MASALQLASLGRYSCDPNPCVGSVVVNNGEIVGRGWHQRAGGAHAEITALEDAGPKARGATVYITLEPCCHFGKTPPCTNALIDAGVHRVVAAMQDPNPKVAGQGFATLKRAGIDVSWGVLESAAETLNRGFCQRMRTCKPFVFSKIAMSLDGRTAMASGESQWITGDAARRDVHRLRAGSSAILTGIETVLADDPALTARVDLDVDEIRQPLRVVLDTHLRLAANARVIEQPGKVLLITGSSNTDKIGVLENRGVRVECVETDNNGSVDLCQCLRVLGQNGINTVMVEAGPKLNGALLKQGLIDEWIVYIAACVMGDAARGLATLPGLDRMQDRIPLVLYDSRMVGSDLRLKYRVGQGVAVGDRVVPGVVSNDTVMV